VASSKGSEAAKPTVGARATVYVAKRDYGTRGAEQGKQVIRFGKTKATIYRRGDVENSSWFFRIHLTDEKRHYRKSLRTTDRREAIQLAHDEIINVLSKVQTGQKILAVSVFDLLRKYRLHLDEQVKSGQIAPTTKKLNEYRLNHGCLFITDNFDSGMQTKLSGIDGNVFKGYLPWRVAKRAAKEKGATIRKDVVRDELLSIRKMFLYAKQQRFCTDKNVPYWDFVIEKEGPRRRRMTRENYTDVVNCIRAWVADAKTEKDIYNRRLLQHIFLLISNSGMRSGEVFGLKNRDVELRESCGECVVEIRAETSKVRRTRRITVGESTGGRVNDSTAINYLLRWATNFRKFREPNDHVFSPLSDGKTSARDVYYHAYKQLRLKLKDIGLEWFDTYHCRHFWITNRLMAEEPIYQVAQAAGTSTAEIEKTYSHILTELSTRKFGNKQVVYEEDGSWEVKQRAKSVKV